MTDLPEPAPLTILIADNNASVRASLRELLDTYGTPIVAGEAATAAEVVQQLGTGRWRVLLLDISLPDQNGLKLLPSLVQTFPSVRVLMLSFHTESFYVHRSLQAGAAGYLSKDSAPDELLQALRAVCQGQTYVGRGLRSSLA